MRILADWLLLLEVQKKNFRYSVPFENFLEQNHIITKRFFAYNLQTTIIVNSAEHLVKNKTTKKSNHLYACVVLFF